MKKLLFITTLLLTACTTDFSTCPENPYEVHDFNPTTLHDNYQWAKCSYCGLIIRKPYNSDYLEVKDPKTQNLIKVPKTKFFPKYMNQYELK